MYEPYLIESGILVDPVTLSGGGVPNPQGVDASALPLGGGKAVSDQGDDVFDVARLSVLDDVHAPVGEMHLESLFVGLRHGAAPRRSPPSWGTVTHLGHPGRRYRNCWLITATIKK